MQNDGKKYQLGSNAFWMWPIAVIPGGMTMIALSDGAFIAAGISALFTWILIYLGLRLRVEHKIRTTHFRPRGGEARALPTDVVDPAYADAPQQPLRIKIVDGDALLADVRANARDFADQQRGWRKIRSEAPAGIVILGLGLLSAYSPRYGAIAMGLVIVGFVAAYIVERLIRRGDAADDRTDERPPPDRQAGLLMLRVFGESVIGRAVAVCWWQGGHGWSALLAGPDMMAPEPSVGALVNAYATSDDRIDEIKAEYAREGGLVQTKAEADAALLKYRMDSRYETRLLCDHGIWRYVVDEMAKINEFIVFDLSGVDEVAAGALYELDMILKRVPLGKVLFVIDDETPVEEVEAAAQAMWRRVGGQSPNLADGGGTMLIARFAVDNLLIRAAGGRLDPGFVEEIMWPLGDLIRRDGRNVTGCDR